MMCVPLELSLEALTLQCLGWISDEELSRGLLSDFLSVQLFRGIYSALKSFEI